jgi:hypothetical protein
MQSERERRLDKGSFRPADIPGSTGWHKGEGHGTWSTVYPKHRSDCPLVRRELIQSVFKGKMDVKTIAPSSSQGARK